MLIYHFVWANTRIVMVTWLLGPRSAPKLYLAVLFARSLSSAQFVLYRFVSFRLLFASGRKSRDKRDAAVIYPRHVSRLRRMVAVVGSAVAVAVAVVVPPAASAQQTSAASQ